MTCATSVEEALMLAIQRWPAWEYKVTGDEIHGPCPICGGATEDGFIVFCNGFYWSRACSCQGWLDEGRVKLTKEEIRLRRIEAEQARAKRERAEMRQRLTALELLNAGDDHLVYHRTLDDSDREWWHSQGIGDSEIDLYKLGVCYATPLDYPDHRPSYTIPVFDSQWSTLLNIRHRLIGADRGKYLPHAKGLPGKALFNSRFVLTERDIVVTEGAKKSIVCTAHGFPSVGIFGKGGFNLAWCKHFGNVRRLWVALDPDANGQALRLSKALAGELPHCEVRVCSFPVKPDDLFVDGGTERDFQRYLELARRIC